MVSPAELHCEAGRIVVKVRCADVPRALSRRPRPARLCPLARPGTPVGAAISATGRRNRGLKPIAQDLSDWLSRSPRSCASGRQAILPTPRRLRSSAGRAASEPERIPPINADPLQTKRPSFADDIQTRSTEIADCRVARRRCRCRCRNERQSPIADNPFALGRKASGFHRRHDAVRPARAAQDVQSAAPEWLEESLTGPL